jgi:hypothetical protein
MLTFAQACRRAIVASRDGCVRHVNASIDPGGRDHPEPYITGYRVSDWCDDSTVRSFVGGTETQGRWSPEAAT